MSTEQLNAVASLLNTTDKNLVFTTCIKFLMEEGLTASQAIEAVLGPKALKQLEFGIQSALAK